MKRAADDFAAIRAAMVDTHALLPEVRREEAVPVLTAEMLSKALFETNRQLFGYISTDDYAVWIAEMDDAGLAEERRFCETMLKRLVSAGAAAKATAHRPSINRISVPAALAAPASPTSPVLPMSELLLTFVNAGRAGEKRSPYTDIAAMKAANGDKMMKRFITSMQALMGRLGASYLDDMP
jgi:hypothetical protein